MTASEHMPNTLGTHVHDCSCPHGMRCGRMACPRDMLRPSFPSMTDMQLVKRRDSEHVRAWPEDVPPPRIKRIGRLPELYRCRVSFRGQTFEGFGNTAVRAWNACAGRLAPFSKDTT